MPQAATQGKWFGRSGWLRVKYLPPQDDIIHAVAETNNLMASALHIAPNMTRIMDAMKPKDYYLTVVI